jgi:hypothetical protein
MKSAKLYSVAAALITLTLFASSGHSKKEEMKIAIY